MAGLKGQWEYSVDSKGRIALPAKLRRAIKPEANDALTVTRGFEPCLLAYPSTEWEKVENQLGGLNTSRRESRSLMRTLLRWADDVSLDAQGRMALSKRHLDFAGITDRVIIVGMLDRIEIWSPDKFDEINEDQAFAYDDLAEVVLGGGSLPTTDEDLNE